MNASLECVVCYSCQLPGPELGQLVLFDTAALKVALCCATVLCTSFARGSSRRWCLRSCSERTCAHAPLPCMSKSQQSTNIRCYHHSPWRFNWIQIRFREPFLSGICVLAWQDIHFSAGMESTWWAVLPPRCLVSSKIHLHVKGNEMITRLLLCVCVCAALQSGTKWSKIWNNAP